MKVTHEPSDLCLLEQYRRGDCSAFESLVDRWQAPLLRFAFSFRRERAAAEDSVQETFLRFLRSTPECGSSGSLGPWFFQVCRNLCLDAMKKETREDGRVEKAVEPNLPLTPVEVAEGAELRALVSDEMDRLPEKEREVLQLKIHEGLKYKEIAEVVGVAPGTVGWLVHQALGRLSSRLSSVASSG